ncbi:helix-turn-helix domain-containing protein [Aquimarina sp. 2304DJ70-9]|uniref:helix-turn-helix domain-containing protein n=1 Tax=Aquimarina penaris TaxID=3231044 RepID=UPI003462FF06
MYIKVIYLITLLILSITSLTAGELDIEVKKEVNSMQSDSLRDMTFEELDVLFKKNQQDSIFVNKVAHTYLFKAKNQNNTIQIANGYVMFYKMTRKNSKIALKYTDSIIEVTKEIKDILYPAKGYLLKGNVLYGMEQYSDALESYLLSKKHAEANHNQGYIIASKHNIALLKTVLGKDREALVTYKENFKYLIKQDTNKKFRQHYIGTLFKLSDSYNRLKFYDSAHFYLKKGIKSSLSGVNTYYYPDLLSAYGINSYYRKEYYIATDSLKKTLVLLKEDINDPNVRITYLYLAKTLLKIGKEEDAIRYLRKVDSAISKSNHILETREVFTLLIDHYKKNKDQENQLKIMEKLIRLDSIYNIKYNKLNSRIYKKYDTPKLIKDKNQLIDSIVSENRKFNYRLLFFGGLIIILISLLYFYYYKKRKSKFKKILDQQLEHIEALNTKKVTPTSNIDLAPELKQEILEKLKDFESNHGYLKNNLTLSMVSKNLKTNSSYLSKVININKQKNFTNYINDLRIDYCVKQIENDKQFRQYSIKSIAKEVGFNNIQSFAKAFLKKKKCKPAEYVRRIKNQ